MGKVIVGLLGVNAVVCHVYQQDCGQDPSTGPRIEGKLASPCTLDHSEILNLTLDYLFEPG